MQIQKISGYNTFTAANAYAPRFSMLAFGSSEAHKAEKDEFVAPKVEKPATDIYKVKARAIWKEVKNADSIVILTHKGADGDAVSSGLAMLHTIRDYFPDKQVDFVIKEGIPSKLRGIPGTDLILSGEDTPSQQYDLAILLDCDETVADGKKLYKNASRRVNIDHHYTNCNFKYRVEDNHLMIGEGASSCTEVIYNKLFKNLKLNISDDVAECLLTGLVTDTACFKYPKNDNDTPKTKDELLEILEKSGVTLSTIEDKITENWSESDELADLCDFIMSGKGIREAETVDGKKVVYTIIDKKKLDYFGVKDSKPDLKARFVQLSFELKELGDIAAVIWQADDQEFNIGLRSYNHKLKDFAMSLGGGGHEHAAGMTLEGEKHEVIRKFLDDLKNYEFEEDKETKN